MDIPILYEDNDTVIIYKPAGILVHGIYAKDVPKHNEETIVDWAVEKYPEMKSVGDDPGKRPGVVHRLDRETSGVLILAKNNPAFAFLKSQFTNQEVKKTYLALVWGKVKNASGVIDLPISIKDGSVKRTVFKGKMQRSAITEYKVLQRLSCQGKDVTMLRVFPKTGRTHQIRVHLNAIGHQVVGDKLYGKNRDDLGLNRHALHAESITLSLPSKKRVTITADVPKELIPAQCEPADPDPNM